MKIESHPLPAHPRESTRPVKSEQTETTTLAPRPDSAEFSAEAREKTLTSQGKNAASPAHRAREMMAEYESLGQLQFGKIVSAIARGEEVPIPAPLPQAATPEPIPPAPEPMETALLESAPEIDTQSAAGEAPPPS